MRQLAKYSFANAKIRAMLSGLLDEASLSALSNARDSFEVIELLKKTPYRDVVASVGEETPDPQKIEREFRRADLAAHRKVYEALPTKNEKELVELLIQRYELEELKVALRLWHKKMAVAIDEYLLEPVISHPIDFKKLVAAATIEELIILLDETPYKKALLSAREAYKQHRSSFYLEAALDVDYYQRLNAHCASLSAVDQRVARRILGVAVDIENINWLIRLRKFYSIGMGQLLEWFLPGGERITKDAVRSFYTADGLAKVVESVALGPYARIKDLVEENAALIENFLYEILLQQVRRALAGFPFTIGTVLGYLILKHKETKNIVSIFNAKLYGWKAQEIGALLSL